MIDAEVTSGLDAAFKTIDAVDGPSFIKNLLGDYRVGTKLDWRGGQVGWMAGGGLVVVGVVTWIDVRSM